MGCGKSTIARALAKRIEANFIDTDKFIRSQCKKSIKDIFKRYGEDFFRKKERQLLEKLPPFKSCVIATGGGFYEILKKDENSLIIYLKADFDYLKARLSPAGLAKRPLFKDENAARALFEARREGYEEKADLIINVENKGVTRIVSEIKAAL